MGGCLSTEPGPAGPGGRKATTSSPAWEYKGSLKPTNEERRLELLRAMGVLDTEKEGRFDSVTSLLCAVFNVPIALVSLVDAERQWFKAVEGLGACMQTGRRESFCAWTLLPDSPEVLVVEDALEDARFRENPLVVGDPHIRFYAGAPLVSSANGYRYGTLCIIDAVPHSDFTAEQYNMLIQFAELTVREIEKDKLATLQRIVKSHAEGAGLSPSASGRSSAIYTGGEGASAAGLSRAVDCFREGVMLVDLAAPGWSVLYVNEAFVTATGISRAEATSAGFWDLYAPAEPAGDDAGGWAKASAANEPFTVAAEVQRAYHRPPAPPTAVIDFRPAATGQLSATDPLIGIPSEVSSSVTSQHPASIGGPVYYFGIVRGEAASPAARHGSVDSPALAAAASRRSSLESARSGSDRTRAPAAAATALDGNFKRAQASAFTDVRLGALIGRGAYGKVYRGSWNGNIVAVKVMETHAAVGAGGSGSGGQDGVFEAVLSSNLSHPNIVHTYQYGVRPMTAPPGSDGRSATWESHGTAPAAGGPAHGSEPGSCATLNEVWLVSEFCNRGPLLTAVERGAFLTQPSLQYGQPNLIAVLQTMQEVAAAMQYLHGHDILHGDLTGGNVLLTASDKDARGFTAKVVDFGLSRVCSAEYLRTRTLGCAEYMPPELITEGILTKAADVYAYGVLAWEMYCGRRGWGGMKPTEVLRRVAAREVLSFPPQTPHRLRVLGERCMEYEPEGRPTFGEVLSEVNSILGDTMDILHQFLTASAAPDGAAAAAPPAGESRLPEDPFQ